MYNFFYLVISYMPSYSAKEHNKMKKWIMKLLLNPISLPSFYCNWKQHGIEDESKSPFYPMYMLALLLAQLWNWGKW